MPTEKRRKVVRTCAAHRAWVRRHYCCVPGCRQRPIECAHVRGGTDGGLGLKPSDKWTISLCQTHHIEQHHIRPMAVDRFERCRTVGRTDDLVSVGRE
jgi:hypothetical protein